MGLFQSRPPYLVIIGTEVKALCVLHAVILVGPPELADARQLAQLLANFSGEVTPVNDVVLTDRAVRQSHFLAGVINLGGNDKWE